MEWHIQVQKDTQKKEKNLVNQECYIWQNYLPYLNKIKMIQSANLKNFVAYLAHKKY